MLYEKQRMAIKRNGLEKELQQIVSGYEQRIKDLETELYLMKEQMMAQRTMLKDAIDHGHHLQKQLNEVAKEGQNSAKSDR